MLLTMKPRVALFILALGLGITGGLAYYNGWRVDGLRADSQQILDRRAYSTLDYQEMDFALRPTPPTYAVTLTDARKVLFSRTSLRLDLCSHLLVNEHNALQAAPFTRYALFGLLSRRAPITIEVNRSKNELNPFMLLSVMSNRSEDSIDPFILQRDRVRETITLHPDDSCTPATQ